MERYREEGEDKVCEFLLPIFLNTLSNCNENENRDLIWSVFMSIKCLNILGLVPLNIGIDPHSYLEMLLLDLKGHPYNDFLREL
ncbi:hypothetical protein BsIDN1_22380 [Bacillus safensis]|uniref:Uncharacterized protein n=1 Tax=Bacillus safensis TaxID=561879 RepID=A0A5S9M4U9_BACIA|nr:hypothetical protein BsIDN1_22380 [Bacillus safensis]